MNITPPKLPIIRKLTLTAAVVAALGLIGGPPAAADSTRPLRDSAVGAPKRAGPAAPGGGGAAQRPSRGEVVTDDPVVNALVTATGRSQTEVRVLLVTQEALGKVAGQLVGELGETRTGGAYFEAADQLVVTVLDAEGADRVRVEGVTARTVTRSTADLKAIQATFEPDQVANTGWSIDTASNQVVLMLPQTIDPAARAKTDRLIATARGHGDAVRVERFAGQFKLLFGDIAGGDPINGSGGPEDDCSAAFTVSDGKTANWVLTAGHCATHYPYFKSGIYHLDLGPTVDAWPPERGGYDDALIRIDGPLYPLGAVWLYGGGFVSVHGGAWPVQGQSVCKSGRTTQVTCGKVIATDYYSSATGVHGLIATDICARGGDSGGALFAGNTALGILSSGLVTAGLCGNSTSNYSFYRPIMPDLEYWGVHLIGGP